MAADENSSGSPNVDILVDGAELPDDHFQEYVVERDMFQPDMATIMLNNQGNRYTDKKIGAAVEIKVGDKKTSIFKGEIVGLEPTFGEKSRIMIRCMNKLHRLLRIRKSRTWTDKSDEEVLKAVVGDAGLTLEWKHDKSIKYKHVYQHNQTDLEFIRVRAARLGCHVWCIDTKVFVKEPDFGATCGITLKVAKAAKDAQLMSFAPRMSSAGVVKKVTVRGWNPEKKELIEGSFSAGSSQLGAKHASAAANDHGKEETFVADHPITSKEEADALAKARLVDMCLTYITGEAQVKGTEPKLELGKTVTIEANFEKKDDPFNGPYFIMGVTHRHKTKSEGGGGAAKPAHAIIKLARDAQGPK